MQLVAKVLPGLSLIRDVAARSQIHRIQHNGGNGTRATNGRSPDASAAAHEGLDLQNIPRQFDHFPLPKAKRGQLLVKTRAVGLNAIDWKIHEGQMRPFLPPKLPYIPCTDVAGITEFLQTGVHESAVTDPVMGWTTLQRGGGLAEYAVLDEKHSARIPPEVAMHDASCLVSAGCAALQALRDKGGLRYDGSFSEFRKVMILGAAGGVGHYAVQIAKLGGAQVTAVTNSAKAGFVRQLGADDVIEYQNTELLEFPQIREGLYDIILDCSTSGISFSKVRFLLNDEGRLICLSSSKSIILQKVKQALHLAQKRKVFFVCKPNHEDLSQLLDWAKSGRLRTMLDTSHAFERAPLSWMRLRAGHPAGKVIVSIG
eukprot:SM000004S14900  [mRNA]  locus=s4:122927:125466:+ [translate_table: standard]